MRLNYPAPALLAVALLAGCASLPPERGYAETNELVRARLGTAPDWPQAPASAIELPQAPLQSADAIRLAFLNNPQVRHAYARLGLGRAELESARRLSNPSFGFLKLSPQGGPGAQITRSLSWGFADALLLPARKRFAAGELARLQQEVAGELLTLATQVEVAWFETVSAQQVAAMRDLVAQAAEHGAELAQRFFDAGNVNRLQLEQEKAAATRARIDSARAAADALRARSALAALIGLPARSNWTITAQLAAPTAPDFEVNKLVELALAQRVDLAAAQRAVALREDALGVSKRWRWLGGLEFEYERESEPDGGILRGPGARLELPIFSQGQGEIARANAELLSARADLDALVFAVENDARLGIDQVGVSFEIVERYRTALVPQHEAILARTQEQVNFMLRGVFELIAERQSAYDAYQEYLEAVRDHWLARAHLRQVVGGRLPDDDSVPTPTLGVEAVLPTAAPAMDHSMHNMTGGDDPHAGHDMSKMPSDPPKAVSDPHAGHTMKSDAPMDHSMHQMPAEKAKPADPHAGHDMPSDPLKAASDAHAGHTMKSDAPIDHSMHQMPAEKAKPADPHAGHDMPAADPPKHDDPSRKKSTSQDGDRP